MEQASHSRRRRRAPATVWGGSDDDEDEEMEEEEEIVKDVGNSQRRRRAASTACSTLGGSEREFIGDDEMEEAGKVMVLATKRKAVFDEPRAKRRRSDGPVAEHIYIDSDRFSHAYIVEDDDEMETVEEAAERERVQRLADETTDDESDDGMDEESDSDSEEAVTPSMFFSRNFLIPR